MAFDSKQTKSARAAVVIVLLILAAVLVVVVFSGALTSKASSTQASAQASGSSEPASAQASAAGSSSSGSGSSSGSDSSSGSSGSNLSTMDDVNATYGTAEKQLESAYDNDTGNPAALLNYANGYYDWGSAAMQVAKSDDDQAHVRDLFSKAEGLYTQYLEKNPDSNSVIVDRAISVFYTGDHKKAISQLEEFTAKNDSFAAAWANLGTFYEADGQRDKAKDAYQKAVDKATDNDVKTFAQGKLDALDGK